MNNTTRRAALSRRMHRAMIALNTETPQPLLSRLPVLWFNVTILCFLLLILSLSTRAALLYRAEVQQLNSRVEQFSVFKAEQKEVRHAALIAYQDHLEAVLPAARPTRKQPVPVVARIRPKAIIKRAKAPLAPQPPAIELSVKRSVQSEPATVEEAIQRLLRGRDDRALAWLSRAHVAQSLAGDSWAGLRSKAIITRRAEHQYQLGVLYNAQANHGKSLRWLGRALERSDDPRYLRAFAISADESGEKQRAINAYRRYLRADAATDSLDIRMRLSALEDS